MDLKHLLQSNLIQWNLQDIYLKRIRSLYPEYNIFHSHNFPQFVSFRLKTDEQIHNHLDDVHIHYTQLSAITL